MAPRRAAGVTSPAVAAHRGMTSTGVRSSRTAATATAGQRALQERGAPLTDDDQGGRRTPRRTRAGHVRGHAPTALPQRAPPRRKGTAPSSPKLQRAHSCTVLVRVATAARSAAYQTADAVDREARQRPGQLLPRPRGGAGRSRLERGDAASRTTTSAEPSRRGGGRASSRARSGSTGEVEADGAEGRCSTSRRRRTCSISRRRRRKVPGYDLTFSAPKSVSVVFGIAEPDVQRRVLEAHRVAVDAALAYLEREAVRVRRGQGGRQVIEADGLLAAAFDHRTSRAGDPQLHTHVLIANQSRGVDGRWSALDGRLLYSHAKTAGYVYQAVLRAQVTERVGLGWAPRAQGVGEIAGVPAEVLKAFSRRRAEIEAELERLGTSGRTAAQVATLATRRAKDYRVSPEKLMPQWRARVGGARVRAARADRRCSSAGRCPSRGSSSRSCSPSCVSPSGMTAQRSTFSRRDLLQVLAERSDPSERGDGGRAAADGRRVPGVGRGRAGHGGRGAALLGPGAGREGARDRRARDAVRRAEARPDRDRRTGSSRRCGGVRRCRASSA